MATRSIKDATPATPSGKVNAGPSPFPLLILALLIGAILIIKVRAQEPAEPATAIPLAAHSALPEYFQ